MHLCLVIYMKEHGPSCKCFLSPAFDCSVLRLAPSRSRPAPGAPLPTPHGAPAAAGPASVPAGTAWAAPRRSSGRGGSRESGGRSSPGRPAQVRRMGRVEEKEEAGWWRMTMPHWPGQTPCHSLREAPGIGEWSQLRLIAPWICNLIPCSR